ncbi:sigma-70 family RNA polymerase sigma factor [Alkalihalobacillus sp. LMS39]|uniref:sigma-70 family RNA polymerase sigma factor n=1 Tax=Alkalihalobacillus sp. LMS39 TaxID=2924032 RepID=UPI001FB28E25|nr:sigma-70 family RNA polymerase sigma factor [Alkalihalobacillus sp. LMS39]UOE94926.1 sigma-70 family RNA polymerase sigma factor [Alkalihalobacillus sp. LMS39]
MEQLVVQAKKGNSEAFYELMILNKEKLYRIALSYLRNEQEALEALQEVTYRAFKQIKKLKQPSYFSTWLIRILINYCIDEQKKKGKVITFAEVEQPSYQDNHALTLDVQIQITKLRSEYQHVLILRYFQDLTIPEIARVLEKPEGTIKTWIHQAINELKGQWKEGDLRA